MIVSKLYLLLIMLSFIGCKTSNSTDSTLRQVAVNECPKGLVKALSINAKWPNNIDCVLPEWDGVFSRNCAKEMGMFCGESQIDQCEILPSGSHTCVAYNRPPAPVVTPIDTSSTDEACAFLLGALKNQTYKDKIGRFSIHFLPDERQLVSTDQQLADFGIEPATLEYVIKSIEGQCHVVSKNTTVYYSVSSEDKPETPTATNGSMLFLSSP